MNTRRSYRVDAKVQARVDRALVALEGSPGVYHPGAPITQADLVSSALAAEVDRLEAEYNGAAQFPRTRRKVRAGRPRATID